MRLILLLSRITLIALFLIAIIPSAEGQIVKSAENKRALEKHIYDLQEGVLLIRLPSKNNKIKALRKIMENDQTSRDNRRIIKNRIKETVVTRDLENRLIVDAFKEYYGFSEYRFMYDTATVHLFKGKSRGYFLNDSLEVDSTISIFLGEPIYTLKYGQTSSPGTHSLEGFIITDNFNEELKKPFPYFTKVAYSFGSFFSAFIGKPSVPRFNKMVYRLDKRLFKRLEETNDQFGIEE